MQPWNLTEICYATDVPSSPAADQRKFQNFANVNFNFLSLLALVSILFFFLLKIAL